jgi:hypothetical protein
VEGRYLSKAGQVVPDRINVVYSDTPLALSTNFEHLAAYVGELKNAAGEALSEETILISVLQVYHSV